MRIYSDFDFDRFQPWSGAVTTYNRIAEENKGDELEWLLDELYPDGMTETQFNDLLWFETDLIYEFLGISDEEETVDFTKYETFEEFCTGFACVDCPLYSMCGATDCENRFEELKREGVTL